MIPMQLSNKNTRTPSESKQILPILLKKEARFLEEGKELTNLEARKLKKLT